MKKQIFIIAYFFFNSFLLPAGLFYTTLSTPYFFLKNINSQGFVKYLLAFLMILSTFMVFQSIGGVSPFEMIKSTILLVSCFIFYFYFVNYLQSKNLYHEFNFIVSFNLILSCVAIIFFFTPLDYLFWHKSVYTSGIDSSSRLKLFASEASVYSLSLVPLILFFSILLLRNNSLKLLKNLVYLLFSLALSLSFGVIGALVLSFSIVVIAIVFSGALKRRIKINEAKLVIVILGVIVSIGLVLFFFPGLNLSVRINNIIHGIDTSGQGRLFDAWILAVPIVMQKSLLWGIGLGQLNFVGFDIIDSFYNYYGSVEKVSLPNVVVETFVYFGLVGLISRFAVLFYFFKKKKVYQSEYRLSLFLFMFIYQFTGSYIMNIIEYAIWALAFTPDIDKYFQKDYLKNIGSTTIFVDRGLIHHEKIR